MCCDCIYIRYTYILGFNNHKTNKFEPIENMNTNFIFIFLNIRFFINVVLGYDHWYIELYFINIHAVIFLLRWELIL